MITAIIRNKENTLVLELPHSIYDIYEKLRSIGIMHLQKCLTFGVHINHETGVQPHTIEF